MHGNTKEGIELWMDRGKISSYTFEVMGSSSLGTMCHRDEDIFIRYRGLQNDDDKKKYAINYMMAQAQQVCKYNSY